MAKLTATQVQSYACTAAANKKYSDGNGLYFCVRKSGMPYWMLRYTSLNGRREATLAGFGWCIGIALLDQPHDIDYTLTRYCLMIFVVLVPWLTLKFAFYVIVSLGRKLGLIPPARPTYSLGYEESLYWFRVLAFFDGKRSRMPKKLIRRN